MNATSPSRAEQDDELPQDMQHLVSAIAELPDAQRQHLEPVLQRVVASTRRRRRILHLVQEALSQLRLDMKYLVFDLEATRRERDQFLRRNSQGDSADAGESPGPDAADGSGDIERGWDDDRDGGRGE